MTNLPNTSSKNICAIILSYGFVPQLKEVIKSVKPLKTFVLNPNTSWWDKEMPDETKEMCKGEDVELIHGDFEDETEARNFTKKFARERGYKYAVLLDSDEVLGGCDYLIDYINGNPRESYGCRIIDYVRDDQPLPERVHRPLIALDTETDDTEHYFYDKRCYHGENKDMPTLVVIHHYSLCNLKNHPYKLKAKKYDDQFPPVEYKDLVTWIGE